MSERLIVDHLDHPEVRWRFDDLVARKEISPQMADDLYSSLTTSKVVLLLDDSGSMGTRVSDPMSLPYSRTGYASRWSELDMLSHSIIDFVASTTPAGLDTYFLNRPSLAGVTDHAQIAPAFVAPPRGGTPIIGALRGIFERYSAMAAAGQRVLVVVITDGEPSDGSVNDLFNLLKYKRHPNIHVSLAEMSEDEETMRFLDGWDNLLAGFDNSDDYQMERRRVLAAGRVRKFTYQDYVAKILLGALMRSASCTRALGSAARSSSLTHLLHLPSSLLSPTEYFNLDQGVMDGGCCGCSVT